ncbi:MAG: apolipoprotein N-acyltransferase [Phycisphaerales bacterium]
MSSTTPASEPAAGTSPAAFSERAAPGRWAFLLAGLLHTILSIAAFPPVSWWPLAVLAPLPLAWAVVRATTNPALAARWTALGVFPLWVFHERWLIDVAGLWYILLAIYLALITWAFVRITAPALARHSRASAPFLIALAWTGLEVLRGELIWGGYAWYLTGHPLIEIAALAAPAAWFGQYGLTFIVMLVAATLACCTAPPQPPAAIVTARHRLSTAWPAAIALAAWCGLGIALRAIADPSATTTARVALVQTELPQDNKEGWTLAGRLREFARLVELTEHAAASDPPPDLIVWPETMFPGAALNAQAVQAQRAAGLGYALDAADVPLAFREALPPRNGSARVFLPATFFADALTAAQARLRIPVLVGAVASEGLVISTAADGRVSQKADARFNSAFLVSNGRVDATRYDKMELMAFGEVVPYIWRFQKLADWVVSLGVRGWTMDLAWGRGPSAFDLPLQPNSPGAPPRGTLRFAAPICFEGSMSRVGRALVNQPEGAGGHAQLLVNISNDGWFGTTPGGREAHLLACRWRSVELAVPLLRAVNTGQSAWVNASGRLVAALPAYASKAPGPGSVLHAAPAINPSRLTPFARFGNIFGFAALAGTGGLLFMQVCARLRAKSRPRSP